MLTIYAIPVSLYCAKVRIALRRKGLAWRELPPPGGYGSAAYKAVVPSGNLPALIEDDLQIADSEAITEYLDEKFPDVPMLPAPPGARAKVRELSRFHDTRLEPALRTLFPYLPGRATAPDGFLAEQSRQISMRLEQLGQMLAHSAPSPEPSLGDCGYPITFAWLDAMVQRMDLNIVWPDPVRAYRVRLGSMPAIAAELEDYIPKLNAFLDQS